jgi:hypothetical protein
VSNSITIKEVLLLSDKLKECIVSFSTRDKYKSLWVETNLEKNTIKYVLYSRTQDQETKEYKEDFKCFFSLENALERYNEI